MQDSLVNEDKILHMKSNKAYSYASFNTKFNSIRYMYKYQNEDKTNC